MRENNLKELITEIDNRNLVDKAEMKLIEIFIKKKLKPGDPIPKETELAEAMGVSRTVIRESLNRLKTIDIIETKKHKGRVIKSPSLFNVLQKVMLPNILDNGTLKDIFEFRLVIEVGIADFIVQRATPKDIKELSEIVKNEPEKSNTVLFDINHEIKFHGKLYEITGNKSIIEFQSLLLPLFNYAYESGIINKPIKVKRYVSHKKLVDILKTRDSDKFRAAMRAHLDNHFRRIID
ncbi:MAG TPA: FCD domain-containing protein [Bacteroidales bacterium]|nr:FCD domain-containing protein [Bacteroidales bacterium]HOK74353.1 FCD domain-containing protein [Bacteroidales bacterium]HOM41039.1 FCD domain-containing protein [Bacteroidales bacterium]HPP92111.1 FCD domain-containing protein [Bacteroidales bacterium]HQK70028.1 FCD domain-containing protein [Bacteroidales bacterium]